MSAEIKDGGPAFPPGIAVDHAGDTYHGPYGMTLRDRFAGQAMAGLMADSNFDDLKERVASLSYELADAMLKAREAQS